MKSLRSMAFAVLSFASSKSLVTTTAWQVHNRIVRTPALKSLGASFATTSTQNNDKERLFPEELNMIYDSKCNVCQLEIEFLRNRDAKINQGTPKLKFTDLESGNYDESDPRNGKISYAVGMSSMHAVTPTGETMTGVPVFEKAYQQVQLGWLFSITRVPGFKQLANFMYVIFARYRTFLTRGSSVERLVEAFEAKKKLEQQKADTKCADDRCAAKQH